ncbi:MAG: peroxiredoxin [Polyangiales bacterium]
MTLLKGCHSALSMITEGKKAPAFTLEASTGGKVSLADYKGQYVVVYFYPKDNTPGCTLEAQDFQKANRAFKSRNAIVLGVSKDSIASHCGFSEKYGLKFPLLSDPNGKMLEKYDAWGEKKLYGKTSLGIIRSTVVIGPDQKVIKHFKTVRVNGHVDKVLEAIDADRKSASPD